MRCRDMHELLFPERQRHSGRRVQPTRHALVPASVKRTMTTKMLGKALARQPAPENARAEA